MADGIIRKPVRKEIVPGAILREVSPDGLTPEFGDIMIISLTETRNGDCHVNMVRPHMSVNSNGHWAFMLESLTIPLERLLGDYSGHKIVCHESGEPACVLF
jgi:hypothetical protein